MKKNINDISKRTWIAVMLLQKIINEDITLDYKMEEDCGVKRVETAFELADMVLKQESKDEQESTNERFRY